MSLPYYESSAITQSIDHRDLVRGVQRFLRETGFDPEQDIRRWGVGLSGGQVLIMPSENPDFMGVKLATVNDRSAELGVPRIQGIYVLFDAVTLAPIALIDAIALTNLRTSSISIAFADAVIAPGTVRQVSVIGTGPQGVAHVDALASVRTIGALRLIGRDPGKLEEARLLLEERHGFPIETSTEVSIEDSDLVITATSTREPLFPSSSLMPGATAVAVGSHEPRVREIAIDGDTESEIVVDAIEHALAENGNVVIPITQGTLDRARLQPFRDFIDGTRQRDPRRRALFFSSGMSWQDLVMAETIHRKLG